MRTDLVSNCGTSKWPEVHKQRELQFTTQKNKSPLADEKVGIFTYVMIMRVSFHPSCPRIAGPRTGEVVRNHNFTLFSFRLHYRNHAYTRALGIVCTRSIHQSKRGAQRSEDLKYGIIQMVVCLIVQIDSSIKPIQIWKAHRKRWMTFQWWDQFNNIEIKHWMGNVLYTPFNS